MYKQLDRINRRSFIASTAKTLGLGAIASTSMREACALNLTGLSIVCADSIRPMIEGPLKYSAASALLLDLHSEGRSEDQIPALLVEGGSQFDVLVSLMASPTLAALHAGKVSQATSFAATEMVLAYSPSSSFASQFSGSSRIAPSCFNALQQPGMRFARADPRTDPSGRATIFTLLLAQQRYALQDLTRLVLGRIMNDDELLSESQLFAALRGGQKDAALCYKTSAIRSRLPFVQLPAEINLGQDCHFDPSTLHFTLGENKYHAEQLVYYAAALDSSAHTDSANAFIRWLKGSRAQTLLEGHHYDVPATSRTLKA